MKQSKETWLVRFWSSPRGRKLGLRILKGGSTVLRRLKLVAALVMIVTGVVAAVLLALMAAFGFRNLLVDVLAGVGIVLCLLVFVAVLVVWRAVAEMVSNPVAMGVEVARQAAKAVLSQAENKAARELDNKVARYLRADKKKNRKVKV